ncbi:MAG: hypothetical protein AB7V77_01725 [Candidatus Woesearchaeota archaeon]
MISENKAINLINELIQKSGRIRLLDQTKISNYIEEALNILSQIATKERLSRDLEILDNSKKLCVRDYNLDEKELNLLKKEINLDLNLEHHPNTKADTKVGKYMEEVDEKEIAYLTTTEHILKKFYLKLDSLYNKILPYIKDKNQLQQEIIHLQQTIPECKQDTTKITSILYLLKKYKQILEENKQDFLIIKAEFNEIQKLDRKILKQDKKAIKETKIMP